MKKTIAIIILICIVVLLLSSCNYSKNISFIEDNEEWYLLYNDERYYQSSVFFVTERYNSENTNDIQLGSYYSFPFSTNAYSDTSENPLFIYTLGSDSNLYLKQDYNYQADTFVLENTNDEIVWKNIFGDKQNISNTTSNIDVTLHSKKHPRIKSNIDIIYVDNQCYIALPDFQIWTPSDEFLKILIDNGII